MAIKHVITRGFGFPDGTKYIPTRGYLSGASTGPAPVPPITFHLSKRMYQNGSLWQIELRRDDGERIKVLDNIGPFEITHVTNNVGYYKFTLPHAFDPSLIATDRRLLFWRRPSGGAMTIEFQGLIVDPAQRADKYGNYIRIIEGPDMNDLLARALIMYDASNAGAYVTANQADDAMRDIVRQNRGTAALTSNGRYRNSNLSATVFSVEGDAGLAPNITKAYAFRNLLDTLREISDASRQAGTELYFDMKATTAKKFQFQAAINQPGRDRTANSRLVFGLEYGNMIAPMLQEIHSREINMAYAKGTDDSIQSSEDTTRSLRSLFSLREGLTMASDSVDDAITAEARALLIAGRPVTRFNATLISTPNSVYGLDWTHGDRVKVTFDNKQFEAVIRSTTISVDESGKEIVNANAEAYL